MLHEVQIKLIVQSCRESYGITELVHLIGYVFEWKPLVLVVVFVELHDLGMQGLLVLTRSIWDVAPRGQEVQLLLHFM